jgi:hypothetical protein
LSRPTRPISANHSRVGSRICRPRRASAADGSKNAACQRSRSVF